MLRLRPKRLDGGALVSNTTKAALSVLMMVMISCCIVVNLLSAGELSHEGVDVRNLAQDTGSMGFGGGVDRSAPPSYSTTTPLTAGEQAAEREARLKQLKDCDLGTVKKANGDSVPPWLKWGSYAAEPSKLEKTAGDDTKCEYSTIKRIRGYDRGANEHYSRDEPETKTILKTDLVKDEKVQT